MENGHLGWAGVPVAFPVQVEQDKGHAYVLTLPPNMEEGSVREMMSTLTSATLSHALVSFQGKLNTQSLSFKCTQIKYTQY